MTFKSKRTIISLIAGIILIAVYITYATGKSAPAPENLKAWSLAMLIFIGIGVAAFVVLLILFHVALAIGIAVKEDGKGGKEIEKRIEREISSTMAEDEMDKLITLKSSRIGYIFAGIGFTALLIALARGASVVLGLHILFGAFALGSIIEGIASVYYYEKGVRNG